MVTINDIQNILKMWNLDLAVIQNNIPLEGSPERTLYRTVICDTNSHFYVLEQIPEGKRELKQSIIEILDRLYTNNCHYIIPYRRTDYNQAIVEYKEGLWQLMPYIENLPLDRPAYTMDAWRGKSLAEFLVDLKSKSSILANTNGIVFSIVDYIKDFIKRIEKHDPRVLPRILEIYDFLNKDFFSVHDQLPVHFCHGDYHPLNIIWEQNGVSKVIDWEFCGFKPESYDVANLVGCLGMEEPRGLLSGLIGSLAEYLKQHQFMSADSWKYLIHFVIALRFAWLAEWLRKKDAEMIELEITFMYLLMDNREKIEHEWGI